MMKPLLLASLILMSGTGMAQADWRGERTTVGPNGVTSHATTTVTRDGDTRTTLTEVQRSDGTGYTREVVHVWDAETKSWTRSVIGETANGRTWTNNGAGSCAAGSCSSQSTFNGSGGRTIESQSSSTFHRDGGTRNWQCSSNSGRSGEGQRVWRRLR